VVKLVPERIRWVWVEILRLKTCEERHVDLEDRGMLRAFWPIAMEMTQLTCRSVAIVPLSAILGDYAAGRQAGMYLLITSNTGMWLPCSL